MVQQTSDKPSPESLVIEFDGGLADEHRLTLDCYVESITGWRDFLVIATEIYLRSDPDLRHARRHELFEFRIDADRPGTYEVILSFILGAVAGGIIGNRADAAFVYSCRRLWDWYKKLATAHLTAKRTTTNVDEIVAALETMTRRENIELQAFAAEEARGEDDEDDWDGGLVESDPQSRARKLVDKLDSSLRRAASPIGLDCDSVKVFNVARSVQVASFGAVEKYILEKPLTLPPPSGIWTPTSVKFERINNKTGRALIYLRKGDGHSETASYARIIDPAFRQPGNVYAQAFANNAPLEVWASQVKAERGRLNLMWHISHIPPDQLSLFGPKGSRA